MSRESLRPRAGVYNIGRSMAFIMYALGYMVCMYVHTCDMKILKCSSTEYIVKSNYLAFTHNESEKKEK